MINGGCKNAANYLAGRHYLDLFGDSKTYVKSMLTIPASLIDVLVLEVGREGDLKIHLVVGLKASVLQ